jgi:hypothetical protein
MTFYGGSGGGGGGVPRAIEGQFVKDSVGTMHWMQYDENTGTVTFYDQPDGTITIPTGSVETVTTDITGVDLTAQIIDMPANWTAPANVNSITVVVTVAGVTVNGVAVAQGSWTWDGDNALDNIIGITVAKNAGNGFIQYTQR